MGLEKVYDMGDLGKYICMQVCVNVCEQNFSLMNCLLCQLLTCSLWLLNFLNGMCLACM